MSAQFLNSFIYVFLDEIGSPTIKLCNLFINMTYSLNNKYNSYHANIFYYKRLTVFFRNTKKNSISSNPI